MQMTKYLRFAMMIMVALMVVSCGDDEPATDIIQFPRIKIENQSFGENVGSAQIEVLLTWAYTEDVTVKYAAEELDDASAVAGVDFEGVSGTLVIPAGSTVGIIDLPLTDDFIAEQDEKLQIILSEPVLGKLLNTTGIITITNDDTEVVIDGSGYIAPEAYQGYLREWETNFDGDAIDQSLWTHEIGGGGWGNNELQYYTDRSTNSFQTAGYLFIEAKEETFGDRDYTSARLVSKDKFEPQYGRIDIRAKLPKGKGLWPALWMLGQDFQEVGWPSCGEIDIMELIGSSPKIVHGTAHYLSDNNGPQFRGSSTFLQGGGDFSDEFHVFSIVWRENYIEWRMDGQKFHSLTPADLDGVWPFNDGFFFIMNVAVGGDWPGSPDANTVFPQRMLVDYIRLYKLV